MKKLIIIFLISFSCFSQEKPNCDIFKNKVEKEGFNKKTIITNDSDWIEKASLYYYNQQYYVIVYMKSKRGFKPYIYCDIPLNKWNSFKYNLESNYGKSFHSYIKQYRCNCD